MQLKEHYRLLIIDNQDLRRKICERLERREQTVILWAKYGHINLMLYPLLREVADYTDLPDITLLLEE